MINETHNPDVLNCLANLSSDEVFTSPKIANKMLDMLPQELFKNPNTTFLDPCTKSGVFLREIAKRLLVGLEKQIPDLQQRINHIFTKQLYGIAITRLTSLLSRRSVYCSKTANGKYSIVDKFTNDCGNIKFSNCKHVWNEDFRCIYCGVNQTRETYNRQELEVHAYEFLHTANPKELFNMKFDVIIGNPPYQLETGGATVTAQAIPIYQKFVEQAKKLNPRYLTMIIPSRWFNGGIGLNEFRKNMLNDQSIRIIVDYINSRDCFSGVDIAGGVCYFLWDRDNKGPCKVINNFNNNQITALRSLKEFETFIRLNSAVEIVKKVLSKNESKSSKICSPQTPYGILSTYAGKNEKCQINDVELLTSKGWKFAPLKDVTRGIQYINKYKPFISKLTCEHAGNPDKNGQYRVLSRTGILNPNQICSQSYLTIGNFDSVILAQNCLGYLKTKFARFLILQTLAGMNLSICNFDLLPIQNFNESWTDEKLYKKYNLTQEEIDFIESMIKPME